MWPFRQKQPKFAELALEALALLPEHIADELRRIPIKLYWKPSDIEIRQGIPADTAGVFIEDTSHDADREDEDDTRVPVKRGEMRLYFDNIEPLTAERISVLMVHELAHVLGFDDEQAKVLGL